MLRIIKKTLCFLSIANPMMLYAQNVAVFQCPSESAIADYLEHNDKILTTHAKVLLPDLLKSVEVDWVKQYQCQCSSAYQSHLGKPYEVVFNDAKLTSGWMGVKMYNHDYPQRPSDSGLQCHYQVNNSDITMVVNSISFPKENFSQGLNYINLIDFIYFKPIMRNDNQMSSWQINSQQRAYICLKSQYKQSGCSITLEKASNHQHWLTSVSLL